MTSGVIASDSLGGGHTQVPEFKHGKSYVQYNGEHWESDLQAPELTPRSGCRLQQRGLTSHPILVMQEGASRKAARFEPRPRAGVILDQTKVVARTDKLKRCSE